MFVGYCILWHLFLRLFQTETTTYSGTFSYASPSITSVNPVTGLLRAPYLYSCMDMEYLLFCVCFFSFSGPTSGGLAITLVGSSFGVSGQIHIGGQPCSVVPGTYSHLGFLIIINILMLLFNM